MSTVKPYARGMRSYLAVMLCLTACGGPPFAVGELASGLEPVACLSGTEAPPRATLCEPAGTPCCAPATCVAVPGGYACGAATPEAGAGEDAPLADAGATEAATAPDAEVEASAATEAGDTPEAAVEAAAPEAAACGPETCPTGCCAAGRCVAPSNTQCGNSGQACMSCGGPSPGLPMLKCGLVIVGGQDVGGWCCDPSYSGCY